MVNDIIEVGTDSLLVATNTNELNVLARGQIRKFNPADSFCPTINYFLKCRNGSIYVSADQGLYLLKEDKFEKLKFSLPAAIDEPFLGALTEWNDYLIFTTNELRSHTGLYVVNKKTMVLTDRMPDTIVSFLDRDKSGRIWICTANGTYILDTASLGQGKFKFVTPPFPYNQVSKYSTSVFAFDDQHIWLVAKMMDLIKVGSDGTFLKIDLEEQMRGVNIGSIFIDRENIAWLCTAENGVIKLTGTNLTIRQLSPSMKTSDFLFMPSYIGDTTWVILNYERLARIVNGETKQFTTSIRKNIYFIQQCNDRLIVVDPSYIYEATIPSGDGSHINFEKVFTMPEDNLIGGEHYIDNDGNPILSTAKGLLVLKNKRAIFHYPIPERDAIEKIIPDSQGNLWVATRSLGIVVFSMHPEDPDQYLKLIHRFKKELKNYSPRSMIFDKNGLIWIGTRYNGVVAFKYDGVDLKQVHQFQVQQGLTDNFVTSLACDSFNNIIVGSPTGMDRLVLSGDNNYRIENITKSSNIFGSFEYIWVHKNGDIHGIMGSNSLLKFSPPPFNKNYNPQLFIDEVKVNGQPFFNNEKTNRFSYHQRNISLALAAPAFLNEKQVQYSYRVLGTDNNRWSEASTNANINLANLSSGEYTLEVKAFFPSTPYAPQQIAYHFQITPPWWESWWFRIIAAIVSIVLLVFMVRLYYRRKMEKQRVALEKQKAVEIERTRIAHDIHDDLGAGLSTIRFLSEKVKLNLLSDHSKTDIEKMQMTSNDLMEKMNEIIWAMNEKNDSLEDLLFYTRAYAKEYCEENGLQCSFDVPENVPLVFVSGEVRRNVFLTVKESLHNIVKHAFATEVRFQISIRKNLSIKVQDNGKGLEERKIQLNGGNGLPNMQKRMGSIGGTLTINGQNGTSIELDVPLN